MVTWSFENAVETADSMKSRGYGLPGRTAFSLYRFSRRDRLLLLWLALCGALRRRGLGARRREVALLSHGARRADAYSASMLLRVYLLLCLTPVLLQRKEARTWSSIASKA